jgi:hypothetical protein
MASLPLMQLSSLRRSIPMREVVPFPSLFKYTEPAHANHRDNPSKKVTIYFVYSAQEQHRSYATNDAVRRRIERMRRKIEHSLRAIV